jgi:hypothetical protein
LLLVAKHHLIAVLFLYKGKYQQQQKEPNSFLGKACRKQDLRMSKQKPVLKSRDLLKTTEFPS